MTDFKGNSGSLSHSDYQQPKDESRENKGLQYLKTLISSSTLTRKDKNEPARFLGDGVSFKAKLIGILEVSEARGDRMCQEALADLKMAIRAAGEHKQRININIAIDGLRLRDEKTGDCLYHHPVHKISFIAQDMSDSRAFGYIFGSPDTGHRFFGIKTDKAASQVVITMRDLFQVVFELKKKEIEMAKQHIEQHQIKYSSPLFPETASKTSVEPLKIRPIAEDRVKETPSTSTAESQEHIMDLLDLELELNNIQQGINQMDRITPSDPFGPSVLSKSTTDPFGDSFNPVARKGKLPPPPECGKRSKPTEKHWFDHETEALFEETELPNTLASLQSNAQSTFPLQSLSTSPLPTTEGTNEDGSIKKTEVCSSFDVFTDLDPLGTGRSKPYVDKKDFFQDLKNPPKKVLKDLVTEGSTDKLFYPGNKENELLSNSLDMLDQPSVSNPVQPSELFCDAFQDDPFDKDPFSEVDFSQSIFTPSNSDPFEKFADFASFRSSKKDNTHDRYSSFGENESKPAPLKVSLPPEKLGSTSYDSSTLSPALTRKNKLQKANSVSSILKPPSPKQKSRIRMLNQASADTFGDRGSPIMEGVTLKGRSSNIYSTMDRQVSDGVAPEPPPRSALNSITMKPPPLPPKRLPAPMSSKPPPRPPHSDYDYIENYQTTSYTEINSPPLPAPARKQNNTSKTPEPDYYLQPFPLLPPPKKKSDAQKVSVPVSDPVTKTQPLPSVNKSLDITLSQLTKTGFSDLAAMLNMSPASLSKMTLQDLTKCLTSLSNDPEQLSNISSENKSAKPSMLNSECYSALRDSIEEDTSTFKAEFDAHFNSGSDVIKKEEESLFDKYAVFRELLEEEQKHDDSLFDENHVDDSEAPSPCTFKKDDDDDDDEGKTSEEFKTLPSSRTTPPAEDRYAALREICLDEVLEEKYDDLSDKDDSIIEPSRLEEDTDLLPQSRPHSESTESPTVTMKEHQSIIEATIMEEDISALDVDEDDVPEEPVEEVLKDNAVSTPELPEQLPKSSRATKFNENVSFSPSEKVTGPSEPKTSEPSASWAKFDSSVVPLDSSSIHSEGHISPWSTESIIGNDLSPACRDKRKHRKVRRHKPNQWQEDEESEEGWDGRGERAWSPSWRENGWSDGDSLYGDTPPYVERDYPSPRRGRRRRMSPWNSREQSPWEEDDRELSEDQWDNPRWQEELRQRSKHRSQGREDERRRHYDEPRKSRKPMPWSSDIDRKSSRESLAWEDDERYQNRNYMDRRRRKWEEDSHNRNRSWRDREWSEQGMKLSNRYYKDRPHDSHWGSEYGDHGDDEGTRWSRRPRSCERGRRPFSGHHSAESEFQERRYMRSREGHSSEMDYRRKAQTLQSQKQRRKHSQTSPFEDDFSSQFFPKDSPVGAEVFDPDVKVSQPSSLHEITKNPSFNESSKHKDLSEFSNPPTHVHSLDYTWESTGSAKLSRSYQQSPFEDDFAPADTRRCSGRSASSDMSDPRGSDDVFISGPTESVKSLCPEMTRRPKSANHADRSLKSCKNNNVDPQPHSMPGKIIADPDVTELKIAQNLSDTKLSNPESKKSRTSGLQRSDSTSSLRKSESVNIFARNNDPFDDDFFCEEGASHKSKDKFAKASSNESKWAESFNAFSFDNEPK
uniref:Protein disabled n=1 Tax=Lygus hesperus TaxID=30085 RepID=A0A0A9YQ91_LYGHE